MGKQLKGYEVAKAIAAACPDAKFCFFRTYTDRRGRLVKQPLQRDGTDGVGADTPPGQLVTSSEVLSGLVPVHGEFWGVVMHKPTEDFIGDVLTVLDGDAKNRPEGVPVAPGLTELETKASENGWLTEVSHSRKGFHILVTAPADSSLPKKVIVGEGQEVEVFGHPSSDGKCVMLTDDNLTGELVRVPSVADALPQPVLVAPIPAATPAKATDGPLSETHIVNTMALTHLDRWVPVLWPEAKPAPGKGWRVSSEALGRELEEDLSFHKDGIKDFGVHDIGDARQGKRTPIEVVSEWHTDGDWKAAADRLRKLLGLPPYRAKTPDPAEDFADLGHPLRLANAVPLSGTPEAVAFVVEDFIQEGVVFVAGQQGVGKTSALLPLAMAQAGLHEPSYQFAPKKPERWRHVIYLTEDVGQVNRIINAMAGQGHFTIEQVRERVHVIPAAAMSADAFVKVRDDYSTLFAADSGVALPPLVVCDTRSACFTLESENDNAEMSALVATLKQNFAGLPVWIVAHLAKQIATRTNAAELSIRGAGSAEGDAHQVLFLVREDDNSRWLVRGKTRFESPWPELSLRSHVVDLMALDRWGELVTMKVRWAVAEVPGNSRAQVKELAKEAEKLDEERELRDAIHATVDAAWKDGTPLNREGVKAAIRRKAADVTAAIETLLSWGRLYEVEVPKAQRLHPKKSAFLVALDYDQSEAYREDGVIPDQFLKVPPSWMKNPELSSIPSATACATDLVAT